MPMEETVRTQGVAIPGSIAVDLAEASIYNDEPNGSKQVSMEADQ